MCVQTVTVPVRGTNKPTGVPPTRSHSERGRTFSILCALLAHRLGLLDPIDVDDTLQGHEKIRSWVCALVKLCEVNEKWLALVWSVFVKFIFVIVISGNLVVRCVVMWFYVPYTKF